MTDDEVIRYAMIEKERSAEAQASEDGRRSAAALAAEDAATPPPAGVAGQRSAASGAVRLYLAIGILAAILLASAMFFWFQREHATNFQMRSSTDKLSGALTIGRT